MIYKEVIKSRDDKSVPIFESGSPSVSKYNPERDGQNFSSLANKSDFFVVTGLSSGFHIKALREKYQKSIILVIEESNEALDFLFSSCLELSFIKNDEKIFLTTPENLLSDILNLYIPSIYDSFSVLEYRPWITEMGERASEIREIIKEAINRISIDFSTQCRFGKIWQHNILKNLKNYKKAEISKLPTEKTAAIIAAGPSLEKNIHLLKEKRGEYFIISTDTALGCLEKNRITPDAIVSIDGQLVSHTHFMKTRGIFKTETENTKPIYIFDLNANPLSVRRAIKNGFKVLFSCSGHPLALFAEDKNERKSFLHLESGCGTVTMTALDFSVKCGFSKIEVFGADFSYLNGKSYARGTYLDRLYSISSKNTSSVETLFSKLYFRSNFSTVSTTKSGETKCETEILSAYKNSFEEYLKKNGLFGKIEENVRIISRTSEDVREGTSSLENTSKSPLSHSLGRNRNFEPRNIFNLDFDFSLFKKKLTSDIEKIETHLASHNFDATELLKTPLVLALLPYCAKLRADKVPLDEVLKLALEDIKRYTE